MNAKIINNNLKNNFFSERKKEKDKFEFWVASTYITMLSLIAMLLLYYVWSINVNATKGDIIRQLEEQKSELMTESQRLDVKISNLESLSNIDIQGEMGDMEEIENPDYLVIREGVNYVYSH